MQEIRLKLDSYMLTDKAQSWLGFPDDRTKPGGGREGTVDSTSSADRWAEERRSQIKETKGSWPSEEKAMKHSIEVERKMKVQEGRREIVGAGCPPLVQCWAHVSCKNPILQTWQIVLPWEQQWGYCEEREKEEVKEREQERRGKARLAPATICYSSLRWHWDQPASGKECKSPTMRKAGRKTAQHSVGLFFYVSLNRDDFFCSSSNFTVLQRKNNLYL